MFKKLAISGLASFRLVQPRRIAPGRRQAAFPNHAYVNDNLPGFRRPAAAGRSRSPTPALACHWILTGANRLECRWNVEESDGRSLPGDISGSPRTFPHRPGDPAPATISHSGLRTILSGMRWLERRGAWLAVGPPPKTSAN